MCDFLVEQFLDLFAVAFRAEMEEDLDRIARGERTRGEVLRAFHAPFEEAVTTAQKAARKDEVRHAGESGPQCGGDVMIREGSYGKFRGCSNYPECKWTSSTKGMTRRRTPTEETCPQCGGIVVIRKGKFGLFGAGSTYPRCEWSAPLAVGTCPKCGGDLVQRRVKTGIFWGCSNYPDCRHRQRIAAPGDLKEKPAT